VLLYNDHITQKKVDESLSPQDLIITCFYSLHQLSQLNESDVRFKGNASVCFGDHLMMSAIFEPKSKQIFLFQDTSCSFFIFDQLLLQYL